MEVSNIFCFDPDFAKRYGLVEAVVYNVLKELSSFNNCEFYLNKNWVEMTRYIYNFYLYFIPKPDVDFALESLVKQNVIQELTIKEKPHYSLAKEKPPKW
jgi:hypothetical protein